ncbi:hypothetical protein QWJ34_14320 [Saccharibacillus sp. CPCC 101409]|uniref:hypothetical protein n=1 Tax=Saccharibacillus sp. CPCC 101409 TaxID=3058041 RepID=UPI00267301A8|nr:hypothetical protein [Saccharibacillus sp. CPCC 101409]MDO3410943.1 hypothetical protein [Saccharibacillus sp. CPCC 101409]
MKIIEVMKPGITGFSNTDENLKRLDHKEFEIYLFGAIRAEGGKLIGKEFLTNNQNFYTYKIQSKEKEFYILLHSIYSFVAFASVVDFGGIEFVDGPKTMISLLEPSYKVLSEDLLNRPLQKDQLKRLKEPEKKMIEYWQAVRIGEVIYNYWD